MSLLCHTTVIHAHAYGNARPHHFCSFHPNRSCPAGYYCEGGGSIDACGFGKYGATGLQEAGQCASCDTGKTTAREAAASDQECVCAVGFRSLASGRCKACAEDEGFDCPSLNTSTEMLVMKPGYWRIDLTSLDVLACPVASYCVGTANSSFLCGMGMTGPLCLGECGPEPARLWAPREEHETYTHS